MTDFGCEGRAVETHSRRLLDRFSWRWEGAVYSNSENTGPMRGMLLRPVEAVAGVLVGCRATRWGRWRLEAARTARVARGRSGMAFVTGLGGAGSMTLGAGGRDVPSADQSLETQQA